MNFCVAILILKMEENMQHFWHVMLCYFKKGKNTTEMQNKSCAVYGEGAVSDWSVKSGLLDDAPWSGRPVEVDSDQIKTLRIINIMPHGRYPTYSKYPNQ